MIKKMVIVGLALTTLGACQSSNTPYETSYNNGQKQAVGTIVGAVAGGAAAKKLTKGDSHAATAIGALVGASIGGNIGRQQDQVTHIRKESDATIADRVAYEAVQSGMTKQWRNNSTGSYGIIKPGPTFTANVYGEYKTCRNVETQSVRLGKPYRSSTTACLSANNTWYLLK